MKKILLSISTLLLLHNVAISQQWTQKADMLTGGRYHGISFSVNGMAYVGLGQLGSTTVPDIWEYNKNTNTWTQKSNYPGNGLYGSTAFSINGKGYVCLGATSSINHSDLWEYSPLSDTWLQKTSFPGSARYGASCFVIGDTAFIGTGSYNNGNDYFSDFWMYIASSDTWTQLTSFAGGPRNHAIAFSIGNIGYLGTGLSNGTIPTSDMWKYDKQNNSWTSVASLPGQPRMGAVSFAVNNLGYVGTGFDLTNRYNDFYEYDPGTNAWTYLVSSGGMPVRHAGVAFLLGTDCYISNGYTTPSNLNDLWTTSFEITALEDNTPKNNNQINLYPNPVIDILHIEMPITQEETLITISTLLGQKLYEQNVLGEAISLNLSELSSGVYVIEVRNDNGVHYRKKIIKD